jgi:hypothetical protein
MSEDTIAMMRRNAQRPTASWRDFMALAVIAATKAEMEDKPEVLKDVDAMTPDEREALMRFEEIPGWCRSRWADARVNEQLAVLETKKRELELQRELELHAATFPIDRGGAPEIKTEPRGVLATLTAKAQAAMADPEASPGEDLLSQAQKIIARDPVGSTAPFAEQEDPYTAAVTHLVKVLESAARDIEPEPEDRVEPPDLERMTADNRAKHEEIMAALKAAGPPLEKAPGGYKLADKLLGTADWEKVVALAKKWPAGAVADFLRRMGAGESFDVARMAVDEQLRVNAHAYAERR